MAKVQINQDFTQHITQIIHPSSSTNKGGLYLGDQVAASNINLLKKYKITFVITIAIQLNNKYPSEIVHKKIDIQDEPFANIYQHFDSSYELIKKNIEKGNVLIHCRMGISRSASLVIAYLMRKYKCGYEKAFVKVKDRRKIVNPNSGFTIQLKQYDKKIKQTLQKNHA